MSGAGVVQALPADRRSRIALVALAAIGAALLLVVATSRWGTPSDELAYWQAAQRLAAGEPLYDPTATLVTPYTYLYPPPLAQVLAPLTLVLSDAAFVILWTGLLLACLPGGSGDATSSSPWPWSPSSRSPWSSGFATCTSSLRC